MALRRCEFRGRVQPWVGETRALTTNTSHDLEYEMRSHFTVQSYIPHCLRFILIDSLGLNHPLPVHLEGAPIDGGRFPAYQGNRRTLHCPSPGQTWIPRNSLHSTVSQAQIGFSLTGTHESVGGPHQRSDMRRSLRGARGPLHCSRV